MLYINARINKVSIQAFVDSGAQSTIMSVSLAEKCGYKINFNLD
jgi:DNA damage-inducible protein 1